MLRKCFTGVHFAPGALACLFIAVARWRAATAQGYIHREIILPRMGTFPGFLDSYLSKIMHLQ